MFEQGIDTQSDYKTVYMIILHPFYFTVLINPEIKGQFRYGLNSTEFFFTSTI